MASIESEMLGVESVKDISVTHDSSIPEKYTRDEEDRPSLDISNISSTFPEIDMLKILCPEQETRQQELEKLAKACKDWGFFNLLNHGIPGHLMDRTKQVVREFYHLPLQEKMKYKRTNRNPQGFGNVFIVDENQKRDWADLLAFQLSPTHMRNYSVWPSPPTHFREIMEKYSEEIDKVAKEILRAMADTLGLEGSYFEESFGEEKMVTVRMNMYPPCPRSDQVLGLSPHADGSGITLVLQDDHCVGLHVRKDGEWVSVPPIPYALVVNVGDLIEVMSNGRYRSVEHRAVPNAERERLSIAVFYSAATDKEIRPADHLVAEDQGQALYRNFIHDDYIRYYMSGRLRGKHSLQDTHPLANTNDALQILHLPLPIIYFYLKAIY